MRAPHRLAAVLFADISGYSAMMADNEEAALEKLSIFKATLNRAVLTHSGKIIQYFGDGCVCTFDSSIRAVECAVYIQEALGKGTLVPVRVGIHIGDVVFKEGNVYGDAVNIASRIESIGQPGTVLVSNPIRKQVKSIKDFEFTSLGTFNFKNMDEPVEVYALSNMGFQVPSLEKIEGKRKQTRGLQRFFRVYPRLLVWGITGVMAMLLLYLATEGKLISSIGDSSPISKIQKEGIALSDFDNLTGDSTYNNLHCHIHKRLANVFEQSEVKVHNNSTLCISQRSSDPIRSQMGQGLDFDSPYKYELQGQIALHGDSIAFAAWIIETEDYEFLFDTLTGKAHKDNPNVGISKLVQSFHESWKVLKMPLFAETQPDLEWIYEYQKAVNSFEKDYDKALTHIQRCKEIDSTINLADLLALEVYLIHNQIHERDSLVTLLENKRDEMTEAEKTLLNVHVALKNKNNLAAVEQYSKEYERDPRNLFVNYAMISRLVQLANRAEEAVEAGEMTSYNEIEYSECRYCQSRLTILARARIETKRYDKALEELEYAERNEIGTHNSANKEMQIRALVRKGDETRLKEKLEQSKHREYNYGNYAYFLYWTAYEYFMTGNKNKTREYRELFNIHADVNKIGDKIRKGRLHLLLQEYNEAELIFRDIVESYKGDWNELLYSAIHGHILAKMGRDQEANDILQYLQEVKDTIDDGKYDIAYYQAELSAGFGDTDMVHSYLLEALETGKYFYRWEFQYDPLFIDILNDDKIRKLIYER